MAKKKNNLAKLVWATGIFEKEIVIFIYYILFTFIAFSEVRFSFQLLFFGIGTFLQIYLKAKNKIKFWNNFVSSLFFIAGSAFVYQENYFFTGFLTFILLIAATSFAHEKWHQSIKNKAIFIGLNFLYSAVVLASFPVLYAIFMKNKLDIDLIEFFQDQNHLVVFSGYFVFYLLLLLNKQLMVLQAEMLKKK